MHVEGETRGREEMVYGTRPHWGGIFAGLLIIMIGLIVLFKQFVPILADVFWPLVLIFVGASILLSGLYRYSH